MNTKFSLKQFREKKSLEKAQQQTKPSQQANPSPRKYENVTDIGMRLLYTMEIDETYGSEIQIYQALMRQR